MSSNDVSDSDRDLLARLNALKKSAVDLDDKKYKTPVQTSAASEIDPLPARALYNDLSARFTSLNRRRTISSSQNGDPTPGKSANTNVVSRSHNLEDETAIEDLLAELGPEEQWQVGKDEEDEVQSLLNEAQNALKDSPASPDGAHSINQRSRGGELSKQTKDRQRFSLPAVDISVFQQEPASEDEEEQAQPRESKEQLKTTVNQEADEILQRILDEIQHEPSKEPIDKPQDDDPPPYSPLPDHRQAPSTKGTSPDRGPRRDPLAASEFDLPSTPAKDPDYPQTSIETPISDEGLSARFASLALPSVPTTKPSSHKASTATTRLAETEVDTWCIICNDDAAVRCLGCDGDLYCTGCWLEGHRGESAGYEERKHKAVQYNKKKVKPRTLQGAV